MVHFLDSLFGMLKFVGSSHISFNYKWCWIKIFIHNIFGGTLSWDASPWFSASKFSQWDCSWNQLFCNWFFRASTSFKAFSIASWVTLILQSTLSLWFSFRALSNKYVTSFFSSSTCLNELLEAKYELEFHYKVLEPSRLLPSHLSNPYFIDNELLWLMIA